MSRPLLLCLATVFALLVVPPVFRAPLGPAARERSPHASLKAQSG